MCLHSTKQLSLVGNVVGNMNMHTFVHSFNPFLVNPALWHTECALQFDLMKGNLIWCQLESLYNVWCLCDTVFFPFCIQCAICIVWTTWRKSQTTTWWTWVWLKHWIAFTNNFRFWLSFYLAVSFLSLVIWLFVGNQHLHWNMKI